MLCVLLLFFFICLPIHCRNPVIYFFIGFHKSKNDSSSEFAEDTSSVGQGHPIDVVPSNTSHEEISMSGTSLSDHLIGVSPSTVSHSEISKLGASANKRKFIDAFDDVEVVQSPITSKDARVTTTYIILE